jgi:integrase
MSLSKKITDKLSEIYADNTVKTIQTSIKRIFRDCFGMEEFDVDYMLDNRDLIFDYINQDVPMSVKKTILNNCLNILRLYNISDDFRYKEFIDEFNAIAKYVDKERLLRKPDNINKVKKNEINNLYDKYNELVDNETKFNEKVHIAWIFLSLINEIPALRSQDYISTVFLDKVKNKPDNYIDLKNKVWIIKKFKTDKSHDIRKINLNKNILNALTKYNKLSPSKYLIPMQTDFTKPMSNSNFTHYLNKLFGRKISTSELRKYYVSKYVIDGDMKIKDRIDTAEKMGHTLNTQQFTYSKYSKLYDSDESDNDSDNNKKKTVIKKNKKPIKK